MEHHSTSCQDGGMAKRSKRKDSLTRENIIRAAIDLLDRSGEESLTFRTLSVELSTGAGAIYWHIANKNDLLTAACDVVITRALDGIKVSGPESTIRAIALTVFSVVEAHPWVGSTLTSAEGLSPLVRILEPLGQQVRALHVPQNKQWAAVNTLVAYVVGLSKQNADNGQLARAQGLERAEFLRTVATKWRGLDPTMYPFTHGAADLLLRHDDRDDFLAGLNFILKGIASK